MEKKTMGSFMAALRKAKGLTQQQVADKLSVSNKTISKWECNEGYPEITMLPAIAELYSVSTDELLRGDRIINASFVASTDAQNKEIVKYLIEKTIIKFTNSSIVSVVLGVAALILAYTICDIVYNYNVLWIGYMIVLLLCAASIAIALVAFNNFTSSLHNEGIVEKDTFKESIKKCIKNIVAVTFLAAVTMLGLICDIVFDAPTFLVAALPATTVFGGVIAYLVRLSLRKKFDITEKLSHEQKNHRRKHIKVTSIILAVVVIATFILPFLFAWCETSTRYSYDFSDGVGYQYDSRQDAEREYHKLKGYVIGEKTLYNVNCEDYKEETGECVLYVVPLCDSFEYSKSGYNMVETKLFEEEELRFKNSKEVEKFKSENVCDGESAYIIQQRNIIFDDKTLSVRYQSGTGNFVSGVQDIMPAFIIIGLCVFIVVFVTSATIYSKNKKKVK